MILLYFLLDLCFYNFTALKTNLILLSLLDKDNNKYFYFFISLIIDYLLQGKGKLFLILAILFFLNKYIKGSYNQSIKIIGRFLILFLFFQMLTLIFFKHWTFNLPGFLLNIIFALFGYKNTSIS